MFNSVNTGELAHKQIRQWLIELKQYCNASDHGQMVGSAHRAIELLKGWRVLLSKTRFSYSLPSWQIGTWVRHTESYRTKVGEFS